MRRTVLCAALAASIGCGSSNPTTPSSGSGWTPPAKGSYALSGTVRDDAGAPMQDASVYVGHDPRYAGFGRATTDAQGRYSISGLFSGKWDVAAQKPGYVTVTDTVEIGVVTVKDFSLRPGVNIGGTTNELGVGGLGGVTVTVTSGPNAGATTTSTSWGAWGIGPLPPGDFTLRARKDGYDPVDRTVHALIDTYGIDFTLKWAYGTCLTSVAPVLFDGFPSAGGTGSFAVGANRDRTWTAKGDSSWIEIVSGAAGTGSGTVVFRIQPNPIGALDARRGAVLVRCSGGEGQNVWVNQVPDCQTTFDPASPQQFDASGGTGRAPVRGAIAGCHWRDFSDVDWIRLAGAPSYMTGEIVFTVAPNATGADRTGAIVAGETRWRIHQQP